MSEGMSGDAAIRKALLNFDEPGKAHVFSIHAFELWDHVLLEVSLVSIVCTLLASDFQLCSSIWVYSPEA